jgi:hypothetical protein
LVKLQVLSPRQRKLRVLLAGTAISVLAAAFPSPWLTTRAAALATSTWTAARAPLPTNADHTFAQVNSVACPAVSTCTAVGSYTGSAGYQGLLLTKSGSSWTAVQAPLPAGAAADPYAILGSVACPSVSECIVAGRYFDAAGNLEGLLLTGSGSSWTAIQAPFPPGAATNPDVHLSGLACAPASNECAAVGSYDDASTGGQQGLLLTGSGVSWASAKAPVPSGASGFPRVDIRAVTCPAASECVAVGSYLDSETDTQSLVVTGFGSSWSAVEAPLPGGASDVGDTGLETVACSSVSACGAFGVYPGGHGGWLLTGSGASWTAADAPLPPNGELTNSLDAAYCHGVSPCTVVGSYDGTNGLDGEALTGSRSSWAATETPLPGNAAVDPETSLNSVSCVSAGTCLAVGTYTTASGKDRGVLISGASSSWSAIESALPRGGGPGSNSSLLDGACARKASSCVAVGYYADQYGNDQGLLLTGPP